MGLLVSSINHWMCRVCAVVRLAAAHWMGLSGRRLHLIQDQVKLDGTVLQGGALEFGDFVQKRLHAAARVSPSNC